MTKEEKDEALRAVEVLERLEFLSARRAAEFRSLIESEETDDECESE